MRAILLSGGLGTRLKPITDTIPKCLVPINEKALIDYWFDLLFEQGIDRVLVNTFHHAEKVSEHISKSKWCHKVDIVEEENLLGTGGSVVNNKNYFRSGPFIVAHSDNLTRFNLKKFQNVHLMRPDNVNITMMTFKTTSPKDCGIVKINFEGVVMELHEKVSYDVGDLASGAIYIFDQIALAKMVSLHKKILDISTEVLPLFIGRINTYLNEDYLRDIGTIESLKQAELDLVNYDLAISNKI